MKNDASSHMPHEQILGKLNEGIAALANLMASVPDAAAREVSTALHGKEAVEKVAGRFDPEPLTTMVHRLRDQKPVDHLRSR
jgi:hypothetical protein